MTPDELLAALRAMAIELVCFYIFVAAIVIVAFLVPTP